MSESLKEVREVGLKQVFELQDAFAERHFSCSVLLRDMFAFVSDSVSLAYQILSSTRFEPEKQTAIRLLSNDALSHVVVGVRVALWGNFPECFQLLRGSLETVAQLRFVVREKKYVTYNYERARKFEQVSYKAAIAALGDLGQRIGSLHGRISEACNHSTATRAKFRSFKLDGTEYDRLGCAFDAEAAECGFYYAMDHCLMILYSLFEAYDQENSTFEWDAAFQGLCDRIENLRARFHSQLSMQESNS